MYNKSNQPLVQENLFEKIDNEEKAYWLGFLYADGCLCDKTRIQLMLKGSDINHLKKFQDFLRCKKEPVLKTYNGYIRCQLVFRCKKMFQDLINLGCYPQKSKTLSFPSKEQVSDYFLKDFLRGYCDGDGYLGVYHKDGHDYARFSLCGTPHFLEEMLNRTNWKRNKIRIRKDGLAIIEWQGKPGKELAHKIYDNSKIYLDRKYDIVNQLPF